MTDARHAELKRLFEVALELPKEARATFLDSKCGDAEMRKRLQAMLAAADDQHFLAEPTAATQTAATAGAAVLREGPGTRIGPYKLLQQIGEGGFGVVFLAEQTEPVTRKVALKIVKLGMDTRQVIARFEQERQALAMMDHPNIARVLDAGATETGRPYFVMDLVKGEPIAEYCDKHNLTIDERLELFAQVCNAVQHAHGKGIIHRDLKPSNVLVGTQDGRPQAKVIDFGIAKATSQKLTDKTLFTEHQQVIGTLQYMSPEQAEGSLDIDTRTDVYSLGVLLYELLTGSTPFDQRTVKDAMFGELRRMIREVEPPRPSTRLSESHELLASIAAHRRIEPKRLGTLLRGDLDWIVMKALEKDRARRYETANGLADDVARHLAGEAVVAAPPSRAYRLRKFVRRNRGPVAAGLAIAASLFAGVIAFAWQATVAADERDRALLAQQETAQIAVFQDAMLEQVDTTSAGLALGDDVVARFSAALARHDVPEAARGPRVAAFRAEWRNVNATDAVREVIDRTILRPALAAVAKLDADQPVVAARLRHTLARRYHGLGLYDAAQPLIDRALAVLRARLDAQDSTLLDAIEEKAWLAQEQGRLDEAAPLYAEVLASRRAANGETHRTTLRAIWNMGHVRQAQGQLAEAEAFFREVLRKSPGVLADRDPLVLDVQSDLGLLLQGRGQLDEAEKLLREAIAGRAASEGEASSDALESYDHLALLLADRGKLAEAEALHRRTLAGRRQALGEEHPETLISIDNLATVLQALGRPAEAEPMFRDALVVWRRRYGDDHAEALVPLNNLGLLLSEQGRLDEAEPLLREAVERRTRVLGPEHPATLTSLNNLGTLLHRSRRFDEAEVIYRRSLEARRRLSGDDDPLTLGALNNLGVMLVEAGKPAEAEPLVRATMQGLQRLLGPRNSNAMASIANLGAVLVALERFDEAESMFREAIDKQRQVLGDDHPGTLNSVLLLGGLWWERARHGEVVTLLAPIESAARKAFTGSNALLVGRMLVFLCGARAALAKNAAELAAAEAGLQEAWSILAADAPPVPKDVRRVAKAFVELYTAWDELEPGTGRDARATEWRTKLDSIGK